MWLFGTIIGVLIGTVISGFYGGLLGAMAGYLGGVFLKDSINSATADLKHQLQVLEAALQQINKRMDTLEKNTSPPKAVADAVVVSTPAVIQQLAFPATEPVQPSEEIQPPENIPLWMQPQMRQKTEAHEPPLPAAEPAAVAEAITPSALSLKLPEVNEKLAQPDLVDPATEYLTMLATKAKQAVRQFIFGGNTLVKVGSLILFLGLAFLLRYAAGMITVPLELRYAGVAASALALLGFGWKLRHRRSDYALILQGLAIGVLYLTIYAAMKLHPLLPPTLGFVLMVVVCACSAVLAVQQNSLALAVAGSLGGFATPVLASTGGGSHIVLFSYIALLDAGIMAVAWFRAWRVLNLVGFAGTFGLFIAWFNRSWQVEHLVSAELFLTLFFVMFVGILIRFAHHLRLTPETAPGSDAERDGVLLDVSKRADYIDGTLALGVPLLAFGLHAQMVRHLEFGAAFGALGFGAFYLGLAALLRQMTQQRYLLLVEVFITLGVVFATLAIPLGLEPQWTASAWALEAAGIFWIGIRQQRPLARLFAGLLMLGAMFNFFRTVHLGYAGGATVLDGSVLGCCLITVALLFVHWLSRNAPQGTLFEGERDIAWLPALAGTLMAYLLPPLLLPWEHCGMAWALLGLLTLYLALRFTLPACVSAGFLIQLLAGLAFVTTLHGGDGVTVLANSHHSLLSAVLIGGALLAAAWMATAKQPEAGPELASALETVRMVTVAGLGLLSLAFLFVLPWQSVLTAWAMAGTLIMAFALHLENRAALLFALWLELLAGLMLMLLLAGVNWPAAAPLEQTLLPFQNSGWWSALVFALSGFVGGWLLQRAERKRASVPLSNVVLLWWGALWWAFAWNTELQRWLPGQQVLPALVITLVVTQLLWWGVARWQDWSELRRFTYSHLPLAALLTLMALGSQTHPLANLGWLVWPLAAATHFFLLHGHERAGDEKRLTSWHVAGAWWLLLIVSFELRWQFAMLGDQYSAWPMLGWALAPLAYLWWAAHWPRPSPWPMTRFFDAYRIQAAIPVTALLALWMLFSNFFSNGTAQPLPYIPLLNPLELAQIGGILVIRQWLKNQAQPNDIAFPLRAGLLGLALLCLTAGVFRAVHHWADVPWQFHLLSHSLLLQGALSVVWSLVACVMMLMARRRELWMAGAGLVAVVVVKLFLVELSHAGTVERIVSFIVVGVLLLALGYFAPVPPKRLTPNGDQDQ